MKMLGRIKQKMTDRIVKPGPGVDSPPPERGLSRLRFVISTHFSKLLLLNLLFVAFCIPVVTIPASISGMTYVLMKLVRTGSCYIWSDFWKELKAAFIQKISVSLTLLVLVAATYYLATQLPFIWGGILFNVILIIAGLTLCYWFVLIATLDLSLGKNLKNAFILAALEWKASLGILLILLVFYMACFFYFPYTVPILLLVGFSLPQLVVCTILYGPIKDRLLQ